MVTSLGFLPCAVTGNINTKSLPQKELEIKGWGFAKTKNINMNMYEVEYDWGTYMTMSGTYTIQLLSLFAQSDNTRDQKGKKSTKRCLMKASKRIKTDIGNDDYDDEVYEKFMQGSTCADSKNENAKWNEVHIELWKKLENIGTLDHFGVVHLSLWTDLIVNGTVSGVDEEPDWSRYRHIISVDPLPAKEGC